MDGHAFCKSANAGSTIAAWPSDVRQPLCIEEFLAENASVKDLAMVVTILISSPTRWSIEFSRPFPAFPSDPWFAKLVMVPRQSKAGMDKACKDFAR